MVSGNTVYQVVKWKFGILTGAWFVKLHIYTYTHAYVEWVSVCVCVCVCVCVYPSMEIIHIPMAQWTILVLCIFFFLYIHILNIFYSEVLLLFQVFKKIDFVVVSKQLVK